MPPPRALSAEELLRFEVALYSFSGMLRGGVPIGPGGHQVLYAVICHVATLLRTRLTTRMHWLISLDIFQRMEGIWDGRDVAERDQLRSFISMAREHLGIDDDDDPADMPAADATGSGNPPSAASDNQNVEEADVTDLLQEIASVLPPIASEEAVESLTSTVVVEDGAECAICLESITVECNVLEMPCSKHFFHAACLRPWLDQNRSCPLCWHEL